MQHDPIKEKIIELIPSKKWRYTCDHCQCGTIIEESPTLADVLRAIDSQFISVNSKFGDFMFHRMNSARGEFAQKEWFYTDKEGNRCEWNLTTDYEGQTQEVKDFIGSLLGA